MKSILALALTLTVPAIALADSPPTACQQATHLGQQVKDDSAHIDQTQQSLDSARGQLTTAQQELADGSGGPGAQDEVDRWNRRINSLTTELDSLNYQHDADQQFWQDAQQKCKAAGGQ